MQVVFVVTEQRDHLSAERAERHERTALLLEEPAGRPPRVTHYTDVRALKEADAVVLSGSDAPWATHDPDDLERLRRSVAECGRPTLGICAGMQLLVQCAGGAIDHADEPEHGFQQIDVLDDTDLLRGLPGRPTIYASHTDEVTVLPDGFRVLASSPRCRVQAVAAPGRGFWGTQFHPERATSDHPDGLLVLQNFLELATAWSPA